ncbi:MAG: ATP-binding cassette domain-containing protein [Chthoniobacterales bacterium]|nr:ATP-binding cassette domain-containing protein [Chthoniobacterales bacterium]
MLELREVTVSIGDSEDAPVLLSGVSAKFPRGEVCALLGPSGSGKTTMMRAIAGITGTTGGSLFWNGTDLDAHDLPPSQIGYVPQFTISQENLTARENILLALKLRVAGLSRTEQQERATELLDLTGLTSAADTASKHLSGGQRRRLALAMELSSQPSLLLCDEVTSGLDARSEREILDLLGQIARKGDRVVLVVTHSLRDLESFDKVAVLADGHLAYLGPPATIAHYFRAEHPEEIFERLPERTGAEWHSSWSKHRSHFEASEGSEAEDWRELLFGERKREDNPDPVGHSPHARVAPPWSQFFTLLATRWKIFFRDKGAIGLQLGLVLGFPVVVAIFALDGLPPVPSLDAGLSGDVVRQLLEARTFAEGASKAGSVVSGLILLQVILLGLLGANNSAREIAGERSIYEKERFAGLSPAAYVASRVAFLSVLVLLQSAWMTWFVRTVSHFPGDGTQQFLFFLLVNAALTSVCLGISALSRSADQASLVSIYLVGFQLPLSGAVLALPAALGAALRPFIAAYWSWSGALQSLRETRYYDVFELVIPTTLSAPALCVWVLILHVLFGIFLAWLGCLRAAWDR